MSVREVLEKHSASGLTDKASYHAYEFLYPNLLQYLFEKPGHSINILEVGVVRGGSMKCWMELFPSATFYGIDYNLSQVERDVYNDPRFHKLQMSQSDPQVRNTFPGVTWDLIIDDASHKRDDQIVTFNMLKDRLTSGGKYIIEDINPEYVYPESFKSQFVDYDISHIKNRGDDRMFVYTAP